MGNAARVLVVDDDRRMVKTICDILKAKGFEAVPAFTGQEAVELVRAERPECVLMDVKMPGIDGVEALRMMKKLLPDLPVVLMSAYTTREQMEEAKRQGALTVLTKPFELQMILSFLSLLRKEESILVVDDDPLFSGTLKDVLDSAGYRVETEAAPEKVLMDMAREYKLVVVLDLKLGSLNGLEILKDIRARYPNKPVVLVTGYGAEMSASIEKGLEIGAYTCLYKPFQAEGLIGIIEEIRREKLQSLLEKPLES
jgi:DNA-binding NtrC family response regulator